MNLKKTVDSIFRTLKNNSGTICAVTAVVGVGATIYCSSKAAIEFDHAIEPCMSAREKARIFAKAYWKALLVGGVTIASIVASDRSHVQKEIGLAGVAALWKDKYTELDQHTRNRLGNDQVNDIYHEIAEENMPEAINVPEESKDKVLYLYEPVSGQCIDITYVKLLEALLEVNFRLQIDLSVEFNVLLDYLNGECTDKTAKYYWSWDDESQVNQASFVGGYNIDFTERAWKEIKYWVNSDRQMTTNDRIMLSYLIWPEDLPWD